MPERGFQFLRVNDRGGKPRTRGLTEIRGPYYTAMGKRYLEDVLETMGGYVDSGHGGGQGAYLRECREAGFDIVGISSGFVTISDDDWLRLIEAVQKCGMKAKPEVGIQFGAGGLRAGIWGTAGTWGRMVTYKDKVQT